MGIFLSERAFPVVRLSVRRLAPVPHSVSTPAGTHRHKWFSHHSMASHASLDHHDLQCEVELPSEASILFEFGVTLTTKQSYMLMIVLIKQPLCL